MGLAMPEGTAFLKVFCGNDHLGKKTGHRTCPPQADLSRSPLLIIPRFEFYVLALRF
jgi:hypothetical protein